MNDRRPQRPSRQTASRFRPAGEPRGTADHSSIVAAGRLFGGEISAGHLAVVAWLSLRRTRSMGRAEVRDAWFAQTQHWAGPTRCDRARAPVREERGSLRGPGRRCPGVPSLLRRSAAKDDVDSTQDELKLRPRDPAYVLREQISIHRNDLRDVCHRILGQMGPPRVQQHVPGGRSPPKIASKRHDDDGRQTARVQRVALDDQDRPREPRTGAHWIGQRRPEDVPLSNYHSLRLSACRPASMSHGSGPGSMSARAPSMASVRASGSRRRRYSDNAS